MRNYLFLIFGRNAIIYCKIHTEEENNCGRINTDDAAIYGNKKRVSRLHLIL